MLQNLSYNLGILAKSTQHYIPLLLYILATVWAINIINWNIGRPLNLLGIYPRSTIGMFGIFISPFIHGNFSHLFFNSIPFFVLGLLLVSTGKLQFLQLSIFIIVIGGIGVWAFARKAMHIGASGLISGYFGYAVFLAYLSPSFISIFIAFITLYYFGGILFGILPKEEKISWESHLSGLVAGVLFASITL